MTLDEDDDGLGRVRAQVAARHRRTDARRRQHDAQQRYADVGAFTVDHHHLLDRWLTDAEVPGTVRAAIGRLLRLTRYRRNHPGGEYGELEHDAGELADARRTVARWAGTVTLRRDVADALPRLLGAAR